MIAEPLNDRACLAKLTRVAAEGAFSESVRAVAARFVDTRELARWIRSLPQRDDTGDQADGPRIACDVTQRVRLTGDDPNCVERSLVYLAAAELLDGVPVRQLATINTTAGRHTFPVEDGHPVILDPQVTRNALAAGLYLIRQGGSGAFDLGAPDPADLLPWIAEVAEEPAAHADGAKGLARVRRARRAFRALLTDRPPDPGALPDVLYTLTQAEHAASLFGPTARTAVRLARAALMSLTPRNGCGCAEAEATPVEHDAEPGAVEASAPDPTHALSLRNVNWERVGYFSGKGAARLVGLGDLYDPAYDQGQKRIQKRRKGRNAAPPAQPGTPERPDADAPEVPHLSDPSPANPVGLLTLDLFAKGQ